MRPILVPFDVQRPTSANDSRRISKQSSPAQLDGYVSTPPLESSAKRFMRMSPNQNVSMSLEAPKCGSVKSFRYRAAADNGESDWDHFTQPTLLWGSTMRSQLAMATLLALAALVRRRRLSASPRSAS